MVHYNEEASEIWITLKISVGNEARESKVYRIELYPVPAAKGGSRATLIQKIPNYVVIKIDVSHFTQYAPLNTLECCLYHVETGYMCHDNSLTYENLEEKDCLGSLISDN